MEKLLTRREVEKMVSLSRSSIYSMMAKGVFPRPIRIGQRAIRFLQSDIYAWLDSKRKECSR